MMGLHYRHLCISDASTCDGIFKDVSISQEKPVEMWSLCYACSIFFCWCRVLRIFYMSEAGVVVSIFFRMFKDVMYFLVVYVILLIAISMLFLGTSDFPSLMPDWKTCNNSSGTEMHNRTDIGFMKCSKTYVFIRPLFQSFGDFFLGEMSNAPSLAFVIVNFLVLNLMLMNLLIAMM